MEIQFEQPDIRRAWAILLRRRWVVLGTLLAISLTTLLTSFLSTPLYRATATLQLDRMSPNILTFRELSNVDYSWTAYDGFYETQYKIIGSFAVARKAVERLGLVSHSVFSEDKKPGLYARIRALLPKRGVPIEVDPIESAAAIVREGLEVSPVRNSQLVRISWVSPEPPLAAEVANAVADAYAQFNMASRYSTTDHANEFLVNQIEFLKKEINAIEERLQTYGEAKGIVSIDQTNNVTLQALQDIAQEWTESQTRLARAKAKYDAVSKSVPDALPEVMNSPLISQLRQEYASYEAKHTGQSRIFKEDWPEAQMLKSQLDQARTRLELETKRIAEQVRATAESDFEAARKTVTNLETLLHTQQDAAQRLKRDAVEYSNLQSDVQKRRETLNALLQRRNEMTLSTRLMDVDLTSSNIRIMERARTPAFPFRPNTRLNLLMGLVLGFSLGVGLAFLVDYLDNTIGSADQLRKTIELPVLAVIPMHTASGSSRPKSQKKHKVAVAQTIDLIADREPHASITEAYRELRTSLLLSHPGQPPRFIMVTSAVPEEGKTATAVNLAAVLAQLGKRVLLIDSDLRRPRLHKVFGVENREGVSTCLSGLEAHPGALIRTTGIANLALLPSGPIPPNPSELLNSDAFSELGKQLIDLGYDHILLDTPPTVAVSDPMIIAQTTDVAILVVRANRTPRALARLAAEKLTTASSGSLGSVLNCVGNDAYGAGSYEYRGVYGNAENREQADAGTERARNTGA